jgi:hypothetical protein
MPGCVVPILLTWQPRRPLLRLILSKTSQVVLKAFAHNLYLPIGLKVIAGAYTQGSTLQSEELISTCTTLDILHYLRLKLLIISQQQSVCIEKQAISNSISSDIRSVIVPFRHELQHSHIFLIMSLHFR